MGPTLNCAETPATPVGTAADGGVAVGANGVAVCCAYAIICATSWNEWPRLIIDVAQSSIPIARRGVANVPSAAID